MAVIDGGSGNKALVDVNGNLLTTQPQIVSQAGYAFAASRAEPGSAGSARQRAIWATINNRLLMSQKSYFWDDTFNATAQNTSKYRFAATTQTGAQAAGFLTLNNSGITTANTNSAIQSFRSFPLFGNTEVKVIFSAQIPTAAAHVTNNTIEFGLFQATLPGGAAPTDGVFFRYNTANELRGVISYNGTETQTAAITQPSTNVNHDYMIIVSNETVEFWIDREFRAAINLVTDAPAIGQPFMEAAVPLTIRQYIGAAAPATATKFQVSDVFVNMEGPALVRPYQHMKAGLGHMAYQGQNGGTMGTTAQYANNANPAATVPTNTTAALGTGLGGIFQETLTLAAATDGIISSFQNPAGGVNQTPRNLVICGVAIGGVVTVALTTNPLTGTMALNYGHTAVSLATAETGSFASGTTKAPRRIALYTTSVASATAAAGTPVVLSPSSYIKFESPIVVAPGEFVAISHKKISAAPATGAVMWTITFDAYFE